MAIKLVNDYIAADSAGKVDLIYSNFSTFIGTIDSRIDGLVYLIENEKASNRRHENGDLGVKIKSTCFSNPTQDIACSNVTTRDALVKCDFSGGVLDGTDNSDLFRDEAFMLMNMRNDFNLFNSQLRNLDEDEMMIFKSYINRRKDVGTIADELGVTPETARQRIHKTKTKVKTMMVDYLDLSYGRKNGCQQEKAKLII